MRRFLPFSILAGFLVLIALACSHDPGVPAGDSPLGPDVSANKDAQPADQQYLSELWALAEAAEYDTIAGTIDCATGGSFYGVPATWLPDYADRIFGLEFPAMAWDPSIYGATMTFRILVPKLDTVMPCCSAPMFFSLEADGFDSIEFLENVTLTFSDHPSLDSWCGSDEVFSYDYDPLASVFYYDGAFTVPGVEGMEDRDPSCGIARTAEISHFSKWGHKNSGGGTEGGGQRPEGDLGQTNGLCPELNGGGDDPF